MTRRKQSFRYLGALLMLLAAACFVQPGHAEPEWLAALRDGGQVIVFRHGPTHPDQADTDPLNPQNVDKQRHLNDEGRAVAKSIGESMRKMKIPVSEVKTSAFERAAETGELMGFGTVKTTLDLSEGGLVVSPNENNRRAKALRALAATKPAPGTNHIVVTHKPNLLDAFGKDWFDVREGEASIFKPDENGGSQLVARVRAEEWGKLAPRTE